MKRESTFSPAKPIVLIGLMGAGKTCVGRRLAKALDIPFIDADEEIVAAAGCSIPEIFARFGEPDFRSGERKVIARLLESGPCVLATGGGAFMDVETRALIRDQGISVWLRAGLDLLFHRTSNGRRDRPLLDNGDPRATLEKLMQIRYPVYAEADVVVDSLDEPPETTAERVLTALENRR
ncbi:MAG: shikimate kinase [Magnetospirillum sp. WYHS-4]